MTAMGKMRGGNINQMNDITGANEMLKLDPKYPVQDVQGVRAQEFSSMGKNDPKNPVSTKPPKGMMNGGKSTSSEGKNMGGKMKEGEMGMEKGGKMPKAKACGMEKGGTVSKSDLQNFKKADEKEDAAMVKKAVKKEAKGMQSGGCTTDGGKSQLKKEGTPIAKGMEKGGKVNRHTTDGGNSTIKKAENPAFNANPTGKQIASYGKPGK
jgi:hypothetical protein